MVFNELPAGVVFCNYTNKGMPADTFFCTYCGAAALDGITVKGVKPM